MNTANRSRAALSIALASLVLCAHQATAQNATNPASDPSWSQSVQCWDVQAAVVRDKAVEAPKNDTSAVAGAEPKSPTTTAAAPPPPATPAEKANAKRPPGLRDC